MIKFFKADSSVSTAALSDEELSQDQLVEGFPVELKSGGGTPFAKMFSCCMPKHTEVVSHSRSELVKPRVLSVDFARNDCDGTEAAEVDKAAADDEPPLFDAGLICQMAVLGGVLAAQAINII